MEVGPKPETPHSEVGVSLHRRVAPMGQETLRRAGWGLAQAQGKAEKGAPLHPSLPGALERAYVKGEA